MFENVDAQSPNNTSNPEQPQRTRAEQNRENAKHSTGPRDTTKTRYNATRHGLAAQTLIMADHETASFNHLHEAFLHDYNPQGAQETSLLDDLVVATWQLARARSIETNILFEAASKHTDPADPNRNFEFDHAKGLARAFEEKSKTLNTMSCYAGRYHRQLLQLQERLDKIQKDRKKQEQERNLDRSHHHKNAFRRHKQRAVTGNQTKQNQSDDTKSGFVPQPTRERADSAHNPARQGGDSTSPKPQNTKTIHQTAMEFLKNNPRTENKPAA